MVYSIKIQHLVTVSGSSSTDTCFLNVLVVPELTQGADRQFHC